MNRTTAKCVDKTSEIHCPICDSKKLIVFFDMLSVPINSNILWSNPYDARNCPKGDIKLAFCPVCSYITNLKFEPHKVEYTQLYENPLHFSPRFQDYAQSQANRLVEHYNLYNKDIIEIGCGNGYFLVLICKLGNNRGVGFDPAYVEKEKHSKVKTQVMFIRDFYSARYRKYQGDLIISRQTLEHIQNPRNFLNMLREVIGNRLNTYLFFEVPNASYIFHHLSVWDITYEHCSHFTPTSLALTFSLCNFHVCELTEEFEGQFLCIHAQPNQGVLDSNHEQFFDGSQFAGDIASFAVNFQNKIEAIRHKLEQIENGGERLVIWGAGSKGVTFLNLFKDLQIEYAVDINPNKQGMYVPGTGQKIVSPKSLRGYQPDVILVMNPVYGSEIQNSAKKLGLTSRFMSVEDSNLLT